MTVIFLQTDLTTSEPYKPRRFCAAVTDICLNIIYTIVKPS